MASQAAEAEQRCHSRGCGCQRADPGARGGQEEEAGAAVPPRAEVRICPSRLQLRRDAIGGGGDDDGDGVGRVRDREGDPAVAQAEAKTLFREAAQHCDSSASFFVLQRSGLCRQHSLRRWKASAGKDRAGQAAQQLEEPRQPVAVDLLQSKRRRRSSTSNRENKDKDSGGDTTTSRDSSASSGKSNPAVALIPSGTEVPPAELLRKSSTNNISCPDIAAACLASSAPTNTVESPSPSSTSNSPFRVSLTSLFSRGGSQPRTVHSHTKSGSPHRLDSGGSSSGGGGGGGGPRVERSSSSSSSYGGGCRGARRRPPIYPLHPQSSSSPGSFPPSLARGDSLYDSDVERCNREVDEIMSRADMARYFASTVHFLAVVHHAINYSPLPLFVCGANPIIFEKAAIIYLPSFLPSTAPTYLQYSTVAVRTHKAPPLSVNKQSLSRTSLKDVLYFPVHIFK